MAKEKSFHEGRWTAIRSFLTRRYGVLVLATIVLSSLAFRVHLASECSLWLDEVTTHAGVRRPWPELLRGPSRTHPPLMYWIVAGAVELFGDDETGIRSVSLFFGCVLLIATYELCLELKLGVERALVVVALLALSPFFVRHATEARHYAMVGALSTLATTRVLRVLQVPRRSDLIGFAGAAVALAWTHYFGLAYALSLIGVASIGLFPHWRSFSRKQRLALLGLFSVVCVALGLVAVKAATVGRHYAVGTINGEATLALNTGLLSGLPREFSFLANNSAWSLVGQPLLALAGLFILGLRLRGVARLVPIGLGIVPCLAAMLLPASHFLAPRYLAPSAVFYHLGVCVALFVAVDIVRRGLIDDARLRRLAPLVGWTMLVAVLFARLREYPKGFGAGDVDYRGLQRYFVDELARDTRLVAYYGVFGEMMTRKYRIGSRPVRLEHFRGVRGIDRYLVAEFHIGAGEGRAAVGSLVEEHFGLSAEEWRALPLVRLPHSKYQAPVAARLVQLAQDRAGRGRRKHKR